MEYYTDVDGYGVEVSFDVNGSNLSKKFYYFRDCFVTINLSNLAQRVKVENEVNIPEKLSGLFSGVAKSVTYTQSGNIVVYSIQPKKLMGFNTLELFELSILDQVKALKEKFNECDYYLNNGAHFKLVIDMLY